MGKKQDELGRLLGAQGSITRGARRPRLADIRATGLEIDADSVYRQLGGRLAEFPMRAGAWDVEFDGVAVELDEQLHFNRYRAVTLDSPCYARLQGFPLAEYQQHCRSMADQCLRAGGYGGKWTNRSCEKQFGPGSAPKDLRGGGAPRWKQRAFYDFLKDLAPLTLGVPMARIAIWDSVFVNGAAMTVKSVLDAPPAGAGPALVALIRQRTVAT